MTIASRRDKLPLLPSRQRVRCMVNDHPDGDSGRLKIIDGAISNLLGGVVVEFRLQGGDAPEGRQGEVAQVATYWLSKLQSNATELTVVSTGPDDYTRNLTWVRYQPKGENQETDLAVAMVSGGAITGYHGYLPKGHPFRPPKPRDLAAPVGFEEHVQLINQVMHRAIILKLGIWARNDWALPSWYRQARRPADYDLPLTHDDLPNWRELASDQSILDWYGKLGGDVDGLIAEKRRFTALAA